MENLKNKKCLFPLIMPPLPEHIRQYQNWPVVNRWKKNALRWHLKFIFYVYLLHKTLKTNISWGYLEANEKTDGIEPWHLSPSLPNSKTMSWRWHIKRCSPLMTPLDLSFNRTKQTYWKRTCSRMKYEKCEK